MDSIPPAHQNPIMPAVANPSRRWPWILGGIAIVLFIAGGAYFAGQSTPDYEPAIGSFEDDGLESDEETPPTASCSLPITDVPELAIRYGAPSGWLVERDGGTLAIMEDERNLTAAFIYTARLEQDLTAEQFLADFGDIFRTAIEDTGGTFSLGTTDTTGSSAKATASATVDGDALQGTFATTKETGFVTFSAYWAPSAELAAKEPTLQEVVRCFTRATALTDEQLAAATAAQQTSSSVVNSSISNPWGALVSQSKGSFTFQAPSSWNAQATSGGSTTSLTIDAPGSDASVAFISDLGRYGAADTGEFAQTTLSVVGIQATMSNGQTLDGGVQAYEFTGSFQGKPIAGAIAVKIEPYQTFFAHYAGIQIANADQWQAYAPTLNAIQASIQLNNAGQALGSLPALPNYSTEALFGSSASSSSVTSGSTYKNAVEDRASQKWSDAMRGYEEVESPSTGQRYDAPLNSWNSTGPEGSGYYRQLPGGGGLEKLNQITP